MTKHLKIGILCYPTYGGSGVVATELGIALADKGNEVHFISYDQPFRLDLYSENIFFHQVNVPDYPLFEYAPYELNLTSKLVDVALHEKLNILHVHYAIPHASAAVNAKHILATYDIHIPIVTTLHGTDITLLGKDKSFKPVIEYAINQSDAVTAVSEDLKTETLENFNIKNEIKAIPNFIDMSLYKQECSKSLRNNFARKEEAILVHISNFRKVKRVQDVIKVFEKVNKQIPSKLLMIGDGPERLKTEQLCRKLEIAKQVRFLGKLKGIGKMLFIADIFVLPSETESFGLVALEAMASKVAVISTNSGGLPEVNIDKRTGYLSDVGDLNKMANDTIDLLKDTDKLNEFKNNALAHAKTFDLPNILPQYEAIYQKLSCKMKK
ncbi:MAG: N-acetyl-alpha-D-glucosaminyl L-malate synthase BshA [Flavobacteriales bacterium]|jgi:L-malate glycosyltransferase|nr:N-acetyl-alpha-D-glucosaminyl L-malate synthase BshA [Flavobacteriales bacterium]MBT5090604.1 N-acetyl-alpha-D-glucosaminyl L-malate synthase BshA [Flavobacteriales bacterium]MBT5749827.1 N-acetyl-alpha-D-glucosaminyl L-malate synthase BshA [Flavobacteriales bacterium]